MMTRYSARVRLACTTVRLLAVGCSRSPRQRAEEFLAIYASLIQEMYSMTAEAYWKSTTDVTDLHVGERIGAEKTMASFSGNP